MNALLRARPIDPENSFFKVNPGLSKREALDEISAHRKQVDSILFELVLGSARMSKGLIARATSNGKPVSAR